MRSFAKGLARLKLSPVLTPFLDIIREILACFLLALGKKHLAVVDRRKLNFLHGRILPAVQAARRPLSAQSGVLPWILPAVGTSQIQNTRHGVTWTVLGHRFAKRYSRK